MSPKQIRWTTQASNQLDAIYEYIADDNGNAALAQVTRVSEAVLRLADHSQMGRIGRVSATRELVVQRTPYIIAYRVVADVTQILGIYHGAQKVAAQLSALIATLRRFGWGGWFRWRGWI